MEAKKLCIYRFTSATLVCLLIQHLILTFSVFITNATPLTPLTWILWTFKSVFSLSSFLYLIPIGVLTVANGVMLLQSQLSSRKVGEMLKVLRKLMKFVFQLFTGLILTWIFLRFLGQEYGAVVDKN